MSKRELITLTALLCLIMLVCAATTFQLPGARVLP